MRTLDIFLVEDDPMDTFLTKTFFEESGLKSSIRVFEDGERLFSYFQNTATAKPDLIVLDLPLPKLDGFDLLYRLKSLPFTKQLPVIVLSTSSLKQDVLQALAHKANAYLTKPIDYAAFETALRGIRSIWFSGREG